LFFTQSGLEKVLKATVNVCAGSPVSALLVQEAQDPVLQG
jgi:hypothetical protein